MWKLLIEDPLMIRNYAAAGFDLHHFRIGEGAAIGKKSIIPDVIQIRLALHGHPIHSRPPLPVLAVLEGERGRTGIVLLAGKGHVTRISGMARAASPPLALDLERSLRTAEPLADRKADRAS